MQPNLRLSQHFGLPATECRQHAAVGFLSEVGSAFCPLTEFVK
jgi:hypothetical protein